MYYFKITRDETNTICRIYTDSNRTNLLWTGTVPKTTRDAGLLRYVYAATTYNSNSAYGIEGDIENLDLNPMPPPKLKIINLDMVGVALNDVNVSKGDVVILI